jgi:hypothetical protein
VFKDHADRAVRHHRGRRCDPRGSPSFEEPTQARQMLRTLLTRRLVFTPQINRSAYDLVGEGDLSACASRSDMRA